MSKSLMDYIKNNQENDVINKDKVITLLKEDLKENSQKGIEILFQSFRKLEEKEESFQISETLKAQMFDILVEVLTDNKGSFNLTNLAQEHLLRKDTRDGESEFKEWENIKEGDIVKLSSPQTESLLVVIQKINPAEEIATCVPLIPDTSIATESDHILEPKDSTLESDCTVLLHYEFDTSKQNISTYVGRVYKTQAGNMQGIPLAKKPGIKLKSPQDIRDIERARLARVINYYSAFPGSNNIDQFMLDSVIAGGYRRLDSGKNE